jgi:hypothetical protein
MDDLNNPGPEDGKLISLTEEHELDRWTAKFGITRDELREAVAAVGHSARKVAEHLGGDYEADGWQDDAQAEGE